MAGLPGYLGLFLTALGSATLLPLQSEAVLVGLLLADAHAVWALLTVATIGNVLGAVINWARGRGLERDRRRRWFPVGTCQPVLDTGDKS
jgi:membrane protein YqaA with SNARE-associated domain